MSDLTTLENVKTFLKISQDNVKEDTLLSMLISNVSAVIEKYLNLNVLSARYVESFNGTGSRGYLTKNPNITAVNSIKINDNTYTGRKIFDSDEVVLKDAYFEKGQLNCVIDYQAGFIEVPAAIEEAAIEMIAVRYKQIPHLEISSNGAAGETTSYIVSDIPAFIKVNLNQFKKYL